MFGNNQIRSVWDQNKEKWYFSIVDVISVLTNSRNPQVYWRVLKKRLLKEGNQTVTNCNALKLLSLDGKMRLADVADTEQIFRLIQSIPSPKAEPFKLWLAKVGQERMDELEDPEIGIDRLMETYLKKGYSKEWILQRLKSIEVRKELTDEWESSLELVLTMLSEATTTEISKKKNPGTFIESKTIARQGGTIAGNTRKAIESKTGEKVVSKSSAKKLLR